MDILFDKKTHSYYRNNVKYDSVSSIVSNFTNKFDKELWANRVAKSRNISVNDIINEWDKKKEISIYKGNLIHSFAENFINFGSICINYNDEYIDEKINILRAIQELRKYNILPIDVEKIVYSDKYHIAGTIDIVLKNNNNGHIYLGDWKTNENLYKNNKQYLKSPFDNMLDTPYSKYVLQINLYKILYEELFEEEIKNMFIIHITSNNYIIYEVEDKTKQLKQWLDENRRVNTKGAKSLF